MEIILMEIAVIATVTASAAVFPINQKLPLPIQIKGEI